MDESPETPIREGWVLIEHPETGGVTEVTVAAFEEVWTQKGWKFKSGYLGSDTAPVVEDTAPPADDRKPKRSADKEA